MAYRFGKYPYCNCEMRRRNLPKGFYDYACEEHPDCLDKCNNFTHKPTEPRVWWERAADAVPLEKRQELIDYMYKDGKTLGEATELAGIDSDAAMVIINRQIEGHTYHTFNPKAKP